MTYREPNNLMTATSRDPKGQTRDPDTLRANISKTVGVAI